MAIVQQAIKLVVLEMVRFCPYKELLCSLDEHFRFLVSGQHRLQDLPPRVFHSTQIYKLRHNPQIATSCATYAWNNDGAKACLAKVYQNLSI